MSALESIQVATKCGIRFKPPAVIIIYEERMKNKMVNKRKRVMPVRSFNRESNVEFVALGLQSRYLAEIDVDLSVIEKMLKLLQEHLQGFSKNTLEHARKGIFSSSQVTDSMNGASEFCNEPGKLNNDEFNKNLIKPGDENFVYDKRIDFNPNAETEWDKDDLDTFFDM